MTRAPGLRLRVRALAAALAGLPVAGAAWGQASATPMKAWDLKLPGVVQVSWAPDEECFVALSPTRIVIADPDGTVRWELAPARLGRWAEVSRVAVAPSCEWIVAGGSPSSRNAWILSPTRATQIGTRGTPVGLAVNHRGTMIAIGTAAGRLHLVDRTGRIIATRRFHGGVLDSLRFSPTDQLIALTAGVPVGLLEADGSARWLADLATHLDMSAGWDEFVTWWEPAHFSTLGQVALRDAEGVERWSLPVHYPSAALAPDGSFVALAGVPDTLQQFHQSPEPSDIRYRVVARDGSLLVEGASPHGRVLGVTADGTSFVLQDRDPLGYDRVAARGLGGEITWQFSIPRYAQASFVRRLGLVVVSDDEGLTGYR